MDDKDKRPNGPASTPRPAAPGTGRQPAANRIDMEALRELLSLMNDHGLAELEYEAGDLAIRLSKGQPAAPALQGAPLTPAAAQLQGGAAAGRPGDESALQETMPLEVVSPMVGTFYPAAGPDAKPFVSVGSEVTEETVVCLIEAMKVFNEIKAGVAGKVAKVCVRNEETIEFGQVLFLVEPA